MTYVRSLRLAASFNGRSSLVVVEIVSFVHGKFNVPCDQPQLPLRVASVVVRHDDKIC